MATLARWNAAAIDEAGNKMDGASVEVRREFDNGLASVFSDRAGAVSLGNPFTAADGGNIGFHVVGDVYKITATLGAVTRTWRYQAIGTAAEYDAEDLPVSDAVQLALDAVGAGAFFSVTDEPFGAVGDGVVDDTAAIDACVAAAAANGRSVYFPAGIYKVSLLTAIPIGVSLIGENYQNTYIHTNSATGNVITFNAGYAELINIAVTSSVVRSAGAFIRLNNVSGPVTLRDFYLAGAFVGIDIGPAATIIYAGPGQIYNTVAATGVSIQIGGGNPVKFKDILCNHSVAARPFANVSIGSSPGEVTFLDCELFSAVHNLYIAPGAGQVCTSLKAVNTWFDSAGSNNFIAVPSSTGVFQRSSFIGCWFGSTGSVGANLAATLPAVIDGITFTDCDFVQVAYGLAAAGTGIKNIQVTGGKVAGCTAIGISLEDIVGAQLHGVRIGAAAGFPANLVGILMAGAYSGVMISDCDLRLNTTAIIRGALGTNTKILGNLGIDDYFSASNPDNDVVTMTQASYLARMLAASFPFNFVKM